jgi:hypothetical protein
VLLQWARGCAAPRLAFEEREEFMNLLDFVTANICVYFQYLFRHCVCANIFGAIVLTLGLRLML